MNNTTAVGFPRPARKEEQTFPLRKHHPFSPSTLQMREACPYYEPSQGENEAARAGTMQHDAFEEDDERLSDKQASAVADCLDYFNELRAKYPGGEVIVEQYLPIDSYKGFYRDWDGHQKPHESTTAGYMDRAVISADRKTAELVDWKFGAWDVEPAETNAQGIAYLLGLVKKIPTLEQVTVHFVMPHRDEVSYAVFRKPEFDLLRQRIRTIVARAVRARLEADFTKARPNLGSCLFCANAGRCDALAVIALKIGYKFAPLQIPANLTPTLLHSPDDAGAGLRVAAVVAAWAAAFRAEKALQALDNGIIPEGYQLISSASREVVDPKKLRALCRSMGLSDDEIDSASKFLITSIDELFRAKAPRGQKDATAEHASRTLIEGGAVEVGEPVAFLKMKRK